MRERHVNLHDASHLTGRDGSSLFAAKWASPSVPLCDLSDGGQPPPFVAAPLAASAVSGGGRWSLERVDDSNAFELVESRHVLGVEDLDSRFDTCRDNQGVPQRRPARDVQLLGAGQVGGGWQDERQQILDSASRFQA